MVSTILIRVNGIQRKNQNTNLLTEIEYGFINNLKLEFI